MAVGVQAPSGTSFRHGVAKTLEDALGHVPLHIGPEAVHGPRKKAAPSTTPGGDKDDDDEEERSPPPPPEDEPSDKSDPEEIPIPTGPPPAAKDKGKGKEKEKEKARPARKAGLADPPAKKGKADAVAGLAALRAKLA